MKERLMILGAGVMQGPVIRGARELGLESVVVDGDEGAACAGEADLFERIDLKDKDGIAAFAIRLKAEYGGRGLSGVMTAGTDFSASVAWAAERAGLPGIPYEAALNASDKGRMRACFRRAGVPSPDFVVLSGGDWRGVRGGGPPELPFPFPVVVKPVDNMGGRGCKRADHVDGLALALEEAAAFSRQGRVIVEEFVEGPEYSVDAVIAGGVITVCGLAERIIRFPPYFVETGHTMPALLDAGRTAALLETFKAGVRCLGLVLGAAKGDIKLGAGGPVVGEIAARLSGGYMSGWTYPYSSGASPVKAAILAALGRLDGKRPRWLERTRDWVSAERAFISIPGVVGMIKDADSAENNRYVKNIFFRVGQNDRVVFPENNVSKCGNVISAAPDRRLAVEAAEKAVRGILIRLVPRDEATDGFLAGNPGSGPDAFGVSDEVFRALRALPPGGTRRGAARDALVPFPALLESGAKDYAGRSVSESLDAVRALTGLPLPFENGGSFGREFWAHLIRGGYQGGAYMVDGLI
jgi:biotin carboxylase